MLERIKSRTRGEEKEEDEKKRKGEGKMREERKQGTNEEKVGKEAET